MANRIKGITIEIGGDTTKLSKALEGMNRKISSSGAALKDLQKLLKLDPSSTTLLGQKQDYLRQQVDATRDKLQREKEALAQLQAANTTGEVTEEQRALEREIAETEQRLKSAQKELRNFGSVGAQQLQVVGDKVKAIGDKITAVGEGMTKFITAPIVAAGGASIAAFNDVDAGMDIVAKKTGAAGERLEGMQKSVEDLAKSIPTTFETAGSAVGEINTRFGLTGDALTELSGQFIKFAQLNDTDVASSVDSTQKALSAFGLSANSAGSLLDVLNVVGQETGVSMGTLTSGLIQNGTAFQEMGLTIEQSVAAMGMMEKSGANSETVMQGLRKALKNATKDGIPLNQALSDLQDTIRNGKDGVDGLTAAYDLFGKSGDQIYGAVKNGTLDFKALGDAAAKSGGSVSKTFENTLDPLDKTQTAMNKLKAVGADLVTAAGPLISDVLGKATDLISKLAEKWDALSPKTQEIIVKVAALAAVAGPLLTVGGKAVTGIGALISGAGTLIGFLGGLSAPVLIVTGAIGGLVAAGVLLYKNWDTIKQFGIECWTELTEIWGEIKQGAVNAWDNARAKADELRQNALASWTDLRTGTVQTFENIRSAAVDKFESIRSGIVSKIDDAREKVRGAVDKIRGFFNFEWKLPHIKLPHFAISGKFSLNPPSVPKLSVDWYAKAMERGMILRNPTIFGAMGGKLLGGGERGAEAVVGVSSLDKMIRRSVRESRPAQVIQFGNIIINGANKSGKELAREFQSEVERRLSAFA